MAMLETACPSCGARIVVPASWSDRKARCATCSAVFRIRVHQDGAAAVEPLYDESVAGWLSDEGGDEDLEAPLPTKPRPPSAVAPAPAKTAATPKEEAAGEHRRGVFPVRLDHVDSKGAFFAFSPSLLRDRDFRAAFPQNCAVCGSTSDLAVHLLVWRDKLDRRAASLPPEQLAPSVPMAKLGNAKGTEVLALLRPVNYLPEPFCLPLPYYVCRSCPASGAVMAEIRSAGGQEQCQLGILSLARAEEFARSVCAEDGQEVRRIRNARKAEKGQSWRLLPLAVRTRISQWYQPQESELFLAYVPDAELAKCDAGLAGIVLTDRRVLRRRDSELLEVPVDGRLSLEYHGEGAQVSLRIASQSGQQVTVMTSAICARQVQRLLANL